MSEPGRWHDDGAVTVPGSTSYKFELGNGPADRWRVSISTPRAQQSAIACNGPWPTLYIVDAPITFGVTAHTAQTTAAFSLGHMRQVAVVGIGPASGELSDMLTQRNRDLTPTANLPPHLKGSTPFGVGGADRMLDLIEQEIAPYLEAHHPLDPHDRGLGGISLGGLFTCWALATRPASFRRYLAVSPSLYWDDHLMLDEQRTPLAAAPEATAYIAVGEHEEDPQHGWPVVPTEMLDTMTGIAMVTEARAFADRLTAAGVDVHTDVIADENHATIWPAAVTRGLVRLYPGPRDVE